MEQPTLDEFPKKVLANIDIQRAFIVSRLIVAAERLQVFRLLQNKHLRAGAIGRALKIHSLYLRTFLNSLVSLGLLRKANDTYWNTPFAKKYFIDAVDLLDAAILERRRAGLRDSYSTGEGIDVRLKLQVRKNG